MGTAPLNRSGAPAPAPAPKWSGALAPAPFLNKEAVLSLPLPTKRSAPLLAAPLLF